MSELHVPLTTVTEVKRHPSADRLDIAIINGWQVVVGRDSMQAGDPVIYVQPDCMVPDEWARRWGILRDNDDGTVTDYRGKDGRVKAIKLRGEPSFGFAVPVTPGSVTDLALYTRYSADGGAKAGSDVSAAFGITKYVPPPPRTQRPGGPQGNSMPEDPRFSRFTDIINLRHYPTMFDGVPVVVTEKIHGTNSRIGVIDGKRVAGSYRVQRRHPDDRSHLYEFESKRYIWHYDEWHSDLPLWQRWLHDTFGFFAPPPMTEVVNQSNPGTTTYWLPWEIEGVATMLDALGDVHGQVILYGEIYGPSIQALGYGVEAGKVEYRAFDLMINGKYQDYRTFAALCSAFGVPMAPLLATGELSFDEVKALSEGATTLNGGPHHREGVVVRSVTESHDPKIGRMVAKLVSDTYLCAKGDVSEDLASDMAEVLV